MYHYKNNHYNKETISINKKALAMIIMGIGIGLYYSLYYIMLK